MWAAKQEKDGGALEADEEHFREEGTTVLCAAGTT